MGKRQRETEFVGLTDAQVLAIANDPSEAPDRRRKAQRELKFRGIRNVQKRKK
jgi:hypothetical protein